MKKQKRISLIFAILMMILILPFTVWGEEVLDQVSPNDVGQHATNEENGQEVEITTVTLPEDPTLVVSYADSYERIKDSKTSFLNVLSVNSEDAAINAIYNGLKNHETTINISTYNISIDDIEQVVEKAKAQDLYFYNVCPWTERYGYSYVGSKVISLSITYRLTEEQIEERIETLHQAVAQQLSKVEDMTDPFDIVLELHDEIVLNTVYTLEDDNIELFTPYYAYDILVNHEGVCDGYAKTMNLLLSEKEIDSFKVNSTAMTHAWNMVNVYGKWYHLDATWDDPGYEGDVPYDNYDLYYSNFLVNDTEIAETKHYSWDSQGIESTSTAFSEMPRNSNLSQDYVDGLWYVAEGDTLVTYHKDGSWRKIVKTEPRLYGVQEMGDFVYYSTEQEIVKLDLKYNTTESVYTLTDEEQGEDAYISGLCPVPNNQLGYVYWQNDGTEWESLFGQKTVQTARSNIPVSGVILDKDAVNLMIDHDEQLTATIMPENAEDKRLTWESSNTAVATVDQTGKVRGIAAGTAVITVTTVDGGFTDTCTITVQNNTAPTIIADVNEVVIRTGETKTITLSIKNVDSYSSWSVSYGWSNSHTTLEFLQWSGNRSFQMNLTGASAGSTKATFYVLSKTKEVIASCSVNISVVDLILGDVGDDGVFNLEDVTLAKRISLKENGATCTANGLKAADYDNNGKITINEVRRLRRAIDNPDVL